MPGSAALAASLREAVLLLRSGDPARALTAFNALLLSNPEHATCLQGRGLALSALGRRVEALDDFRSACAISKDAWASAASIADITPDENERLAALNLSADGLLRLCRGETPARLFETASRALADARRYEELDVFVRQHAGRFSDPARSSDWRARAAYELGRFGDAFEWQQDALLRTDAANQCRPALAGLPDNALDVVSELGSWLQDLGLPVFLVAGTLLGFMRNGGPLAHDRDIDIGLFRGPEGGPDLADVVRCHPGLILPRSARRGDGYLGLMHRGVALDIFLYERQGEYVTCGLSDRRGDIRWRFSGFGLVNCTFGGHRFLVPDRPEQYLEESYGPNWTLTDEGYSSAVSSPALDCVDIRVRSFYAAARARAALQSGNLSKARALAKQSPLLITLPGWANA